MKFVPFKNKIEIKPLVKTGVILSEDKKLVEAGEVVAVGEDVAFVKVGDTICFDSWVCSKTPADENGVEHYVVSCDDKGVLGKYEQQ